MPYSEKLECFFLETITHPAAAPSQAKAKPSKQKARPVWVRAGLLEPYGERQSGALLSRINARLAGDSSEWIQVRQGRRARGNVPRGGRGASPQGPPRYGVKGNPRHPAPSSLTLPPERRQYTTRATSS